MLVSTVIQDIRNRINDKEAIGDFDNDDIVSYINQAINYIGLYFVTAQNPLAVKDIEVADGDLVPDDYIKFCGVLPIRVTGKTIKFLESRKKKMALRYFFKPPNITGADGEEMPYNDALTNNVIVNATVLLLLNQQRLNVAQDQSLSTSLMDMVNSAFGVQA